MDNKPSLSQYFGEPEAPATSQFFDEIGTAPSDMIQSVYLGSGEGYFHISFFLKNILNHYKSLFSMFTTALPLISASETMSANLFPQSMTASFSQHQLPVETSFSNVLPAMSVPTSLPAASLPDPSTFFDNIGPEPTLGPVMTSITSPDILNQAMETLSVKVSG